MGDDALRDEVRTLLASLLRQKGDGATFSDTDSLILSGRLDSLATLQIVTFLEERYGVDFAEIGLDQTMLDTVDEIVRLAASYARAS